ncbi:NUDIX domain-containing protein [Roseomonas sp. KE2513]|uniref:NUDIX domain-containing protein n=1 Tax=Roseomonas sp. KE2513 TaxID=2479202 RepID=UPI0018DF3E1D|nr:NUDIX domain-containing protein [Roseomonas sp. KE2513]
MAKEEAQGIRILARETLSEGHYRLEKVTYTQGGERQEREVYHNGTGAAVLPLDPTRGTVLLVRQLRIPALVNGDGPMLVEVCAGMVEEGDDPAATAEREAKEELGCRLRSLRRVFTLYPSPGSCAERLHLFTAEYRPEDRTGRGGGLAEEGERIEVLELPLAEAWAMVEAGGIMDGKTILLLQQARLGAA